MKLPSSNINQTSIQLLFSGREKVLLPHYQRPYSWTTKEIDELFMDIKEGFEEAIKNNNVSDGYLLGNIIFLTFDRKELFLLDGQQRLTTLFVIFEELKKHINPVYSGLFKIFNDFLYEVDCYGKSDYKLKLRRQEVNGNILDFEINNEIKKYIIKKTQTDLVYDKFDDEGEMINFLLNTNFIVQNYIGNSSNEDYKNKTFSTILKYFVKFNTRGKSFSNDEMINAINLLEK